MSARFVFCIGAAVTLGLGATVARAQFPGVDKFKNPLKNITDKMPAPAKKAVEVAQDPNAQKAAKGLAGILEGFTPEEERSIGESTALEILGKFGGLVRDEEITRRVNLIGNALAYYSTRPVLNWKFGVLNSPTVNGFSAPGGFVFITRGLYDLVSASDDLLAAVLAHEIGHVTLRHALKIVAKNELEAGAMGLAKDTKPVAQFDSNVAQAQAKVQGQVPLQELGIDMAKFNVRVATIVKVAIEQGYDKETEYDADKHARNLALTTGYAPGGLRAVLVQLQLKKGDPKQLFPLHPPLAERVKKLPSDPLPKPPQPAVAAPAEPAKAEEKK